MWRLVHAPHSPVYISRDAFLAFDVCHPSSYERSTPEDMTVDERRNTVFVIIKLEFTGRKMGEVGTDVFMKDWQASQSG